jgi:hypothetical protein
MNKTMSTATKNEVLEKLRRRYLTAGLAHKTKLVDQAMGLFGYHRKAAIRALNWGRGRAPFFRPTTADKRQVENRPRRHQPSGWNGSPRSGFDRLAILPSSNDGHVPLGREFNPRSKVTKPGEIPPLQGPVLDDARGARPRAEKLPRSEGVHHFLGRLRERAGWEFNSNHAKQNLDDRLMKRYDQAQTPECDLERHHVAQKNLARPLGGIAGWCLRLWPDH